MTNGQNQHWYFTRACEEGLRVARVKELCNRRFQETVGSVDSQRVDHYEILWTEAREFIEEWETQPDGLAHMRKDESYIEKRVSFYQYRHGISPSRTRAEIGTEAWAERIIVRVRVEVALEAEEEAERVEAAERAAQEAEEARIAAERSRLIRAGRERRLGEGKVIKIFKAQLRKIAREKRDLLQEDEILERQVLYSYGSNTEEEEDEIENRRRRIVRLAVNKGLEATEFVSVDCPVCIDFELT